MGAVGCVATPFFIRPEERKPPESGEDDSKDFKDATKADEKAQKEAKEVPIIEGSRCRSKTGKPQVVGKKIRVRRRMRKRRRREQTEGKVLET